MSKKKEIMHTKMIDQFVAAKKVSTPIIAIQTPDPATTIATVAKLYDELPLLSWDVVRGICPLNPAGVTALHGVWGNDQNPAEGNPSAALLGATKLPPESILFFHQAQMYLSDSPSVVQGIWNLRDLFKTDRRTLVLLTPSIVLPPELTNDVLVLDEPLPTEEELVSIVKVIYEAGGLDEPSKDVLKKSVEALSGLPAFAAEQVISMSLTKEGVDIDSLWERKRQTIEQSPGLSVWRGGETFDDIGGVENAKAFFTKIIQGNDAPNVILFIDEIEKALAGTIGDLSGTTQEMYGTLLSWMQDNNVTGIIAIGPPGCAKSMIAKATGNTAGIPTIRFDLSAMKGSLVGESGRNLRSSLKVVDAVSNKKVLCIATCNSIGALSPELRRRFTMGTFFFDLPDEAERKVIWAHYLRQYGFKLDTVQPESNGWTGAEIKQCCDLAYRLRSTLVDAAMYIVPVIKSAGDRIEELRTQASNRFISASKPGLYEYHQFSNIGYPGVRRQLSREDIKKLN